MGEVGELLVKGPSICSGYFNDAEETRRVFCNGWLRTGDLARQDEEGFLWIEGRGGAFLKIRGMRVSLAEVEARVTAIPGVYECGACAVEHPEAGEALVLLIVPDQGARLVTEEIRHQPSSPLDSRLDSVGPRTAKNICGEDSAFGAFGFGQGDSMEQLNDKIDRILSIPPYSQSPEEREGGLLEILKEELEYACQRHAGYENYIQQLARGLSIRSPGFRSSLFTGGNSESQSAPLLCEPRRSQTDFDLERHDFAVAQPGCARCVRPRGE